MTYQQFCETHPILQNFNTGKYGFQRWGDGFNLNSAIYRTAKAAEQGRKQAWEQEQQFEVAS